MLSINLLYAWHGTVTRHGRHGRDGADHLICSACGVVGDVSRSALIDGSAAQVGDAHDPDVAPELDRQEDARVAVDGFEAW